MELGARFALISVVLMTFVIETTLICSKQVPTLLNIGGIMTWTYTELLGMLCPHSEIS